MLIPTQIKYSNWRDRKIWSNKRQTNPPSCILENLKEYVQLTIKRLYFWR